MTPEVVVPIRFDELGRCQACGEKLPFTYRLFKHGRFKKIHEQCYQRVVEERTQAVAEYRRALNAAVADGRISVDEDTELAGSRHELQLSQAETTSMRLLVYRDLFSQATADRALDEKEERLLRQVQLELQLNDTAIQPQLSELARLRFFQQINQGDLPAVASDILLKKAEVAHWQSEAEFWEERVTHKGYVGGSHGVSIRVAKGVSYRLGGNRGQLVTEKDIIKVDEGKLVVTNKRVVFNGFTNSFSIPFSKLINYVVYEDAIQLDKEGKTKPGYFKLQDPEVVAALISAVAQGT
ncbi:MAG: hypothetical protein EXR54_06720 [Dehalococcoidia bacterium]|nr:hypothetical protein [Dehalococcoidia bacterium]